MHTIYSHSKITRVPGCSKSDHARLRAALSPAAAEQERPAAGPGTIGSCFRVEGRFFELSSYLGEGVIIGTIFWENLPEIATFLK